MADDAKDPVTGDSEYKESGPSIWLVLIGVVAVFGLIFVLQNLESTETQFLVVSATIPLALVIALSMALGALVALSIGYVVRRRKKSSARKQ